MINIDAHSLEKGTPYLMLGFLWQIIKNGLLKQITMDRWPGLKRLLNNGEDDLAFLKQPPEAILLKWVNYHLKNAGTTRRITNFQNDISDSEVYTLLIQQIAPCNAKVSTAALLEKDSIRRADVMLQQAAKLKCRVFVSPQDVVNGVYKLNLAFVANLFTNYPGLDRPDFGIKPSKNSEKSKIEKSEKNTILFYCSSFC